MKIQTHRLTLAIIGLATTSMAAAVMPRTPSAATSTSLPKTFEPGRLGRIEALRDPMIKGAVKTWYTPGYRQRARELQRFISGERDFIKRQLGVSVPLSLAVLDTKQWKLAERQLPYPMTGEPPVALMPADWAGGPDFFPKQKDSDPAMVKAVLARGLRWSDANHRTMDLVGGHELGHTALDSYGIAPGTRPSGARRIARDAIDPSFSGWANSLAALPRVPKSTPPPRENP